jgi:hypothetical protein
MVRASTWKVVVVTIAIITIGLAIYDGCYKLTKDGKNKRSGVPLTAAEKSGVQAAIDMIKKWEHDCNLGGKDKPQGQPDGLISGELQGLQDNNKICKEATADPNLVGATTSNPVTGNGGGWVTANHPGVNVGSPYIPAETSGGSFVGSDGKHYDEEYVANLAVMLIHESSHLTNPANSANKQCEYECPAYRFTIDRLCPLVSCAAISDKVKKKICEYIKSANDFCCKVDCCLKPKPCDACKSPRINVIVDSCDCPTPPPPASNPAKNEKQYYAGGGTGTITLYTFDERLEFKISSETVSFDYTLILNGTSAPVDLNILPINFGQISDRSLLLAGKDKTTGQGTIVRINYDVAAGKVLSETTLITTSVFTSPCSLSKLPACPTVAVLDDATHSIFLYDYRTNGISLFASSAVHPDMPLMKYVDTIPYQDPGTGQMGCLYQLSAGDPEFIIGPISGPIITIVDKDGDGEYDEIN